MSVAVIPLEVVSMSSYKEAVIQRNAALAALKQIVKSHNVFRMWEMAYAALSKLPSAEAARRELDAILKQEKKS
jgi:hypothetical protein